jgi:hypothetical protein
MNVLRVGLFDRQIVIEMYSPIKKRIAFYYLRTNKDIQETLRGAHNVKCTKAVKLGWHGHKERYVTKECNKKMTGRMEGMRKRGRP